MPKLKTHKASQKRVVRVTTSGKLVVRHMSVAHRARFKSKRSKQKSTQTQVLTGGMRDRMKRLISR